MYCILEKAIESMTSALTNPHPFLHLQNGQKGTVAKELKGMEGFTTHFAKALRHMKEGTEPSLEELTILNALDAKAAEVLGWEDSVTPWRKEKTTIIDITRCLSLVQRGFAVGCGSALIVSLIHRSNRLFVVASLCAACAFLALKSMLAFWEQAFCEIEIKLDRLSWKNQSELTQEVAKIYEGLAKTAYLTRVYLRSQSNTTSIELLKEQLFAFKNLRSLFLRLMGTPAGVSQLTNEKDTLFFKKFAKMTRQGLHMSGGAMLFAAGWAYYAHLQRAYLMTCIGVVHVVGALAISRELFVLQKCSKKIYEAGDETYTQACQELIQRSWFIRRLGAQPETLQVEVVEPFHAILKLIPRWKQPDGN